MTRLLDSLEVVYGDLTPIRAVIRARLPTDAETTGTSLTGFVRGPRCSHGSTLPVSYRLVGQVGNVSSLEAHALITEPIFWTPDWPALYDVSVELRQGSKVLEQTVRTIGLRPLAVLDKGFDFAGKFWILRGVHRDGDLAAAVGQCREHAAALMASAELLVEGLLKAASEEGVLVIAQLRKMTTIRAELTRLSQFAAVAVAVLPVGEIVFDRLPKSNILLAQHMPGESHPLRSDIRLVLADVFNDWDFADWAKTLSRPVIAYRPLDRSADIAAARAACDRLQRDLAPMGQYAGYIV